MKIANALNSIVTFTKSSILTICQGSKSISDLTIMHLEPHTEKKLHGLAFILQTHEQYLPERVYP